MHSQRIGIFIAHYAFGRSITNISMIKYFACKGYEVDVFVYDGRGPDPTFSEPNIQVRNFSKGERETVANKNVPLARRALSFGKTALKKILPDSLSYKMVQLKQKFKCTYADFIPLHVLEATKKFQEEQEYAVFIGVEPCGLLWAHLLGGGERIPLIYFSQELWLQDDPNYNNPERRYLREQERNILPKCVAIIVQDKERGELLAKHNRISFSKFIYVPVGALGKYTDQKSRYFQKKFNLPLDTRVVLNLGWIGEDRMSLEVAQQSKALPEGWVMVFHGFYGDASYIKKIVDLTKENKKFFISLEMLEMDELPELIASCDIGLVFYRGTTMNQRTTGFSSGKLAQYLQCGLPVIAIDFPSIKRIIDQYQCGVCVGGPHEIPQALQQISANYEKMQANSFRCYEEKYDLIPYLERLREFIENIAKKSVI